MRHYWVVTIVEDRNTVTRLQFGCAMACSFLAWMASQGKTASMRVQVDPITGRSSDEIRRAITWGERFGPDAQS